MQHDALIKIYRHFAILLPEEEQVLKEIFTPFSLKAGEHFLKSGEMSKYVAFLNKGLVCYYVEKNAEMAITDFSKEGEFVSEYHTFLQKMPVIHSIKCIEDCEFLVATHDDIQRLYTELSQGDKFGRCILEHRFGVVVNQLISTYMHTAVERYNLFMNDYFDISQRIPQYLMAAFIGVKPPSLSRIRKRISKNIS